MHLRAHHSKNAFSLVELSIVLVIIGLLVGGILSGKSLIRASELRSVSNDLGRYVTAINSFKDKYFAIPGDMTNATSFWGSAGGTGSDATCFAASSATTATCNGDGNREIDITNDMGEIAHTWKHMGNAGLVEGNYTGLKNGAWVPGTNTPASKISGAGYSYT